MCPTSLTLLWIADWAGPCNGVHIGAVYYRPRTGELHTAGEVWYLRLPCYALCWYVFYFRRHCMYCARIATDGVARSVCFVLWWRSWVLQKTADWMVDSSGRGPRNHVLDGVEIFAREGGNFGVVWPIKKHWNSALWRFYTAKKNR